MPEDYKKEKFWEVYRNLPPELKKILFADETGDYLRTICQRAGISERLGEVGEYVKQVFLGTLPPENFEITIKRNMGLDLETAQKIARDINHLVFQPIAPILEKAYNPESAKEKEQKPQTMEKDVSPEIKRESRRDVYREIIE